MKKSVQNVNRKHYLSAFYTIAKWIGTLAPTITMGIMSTNYVVLACGLLCTIYDLIYIALLYRAKKSEKLEEVQ